MSESDKEQHPTPKRCEAAERELSARPSLAAPQDDPTFDMQAAGAPPSSTAAPIPSRLSPEPADLVELAQWWWERPDDFGSDHISMRGLKMLCGEVIRLSALSVDAARYRK